MDENKVLLCTKEMWLLIRDNGLCEHFTDAELEEADSKWCKIKTGWVTGCGVVDMWIDPKIPELKC